MPRKREFDPDAALEKALLLFWEKGYDDSSFDDIVRATRVSRYGLYEAFGDKRELFRKTLRAYMERFRQEHQALGRPDASLPEIRGYFESLMQMASGESAERGCLVFNAAVEMARNDEEIARDIRSFFQELVTLFRNALANAREKGQVLPGIDIEDWAVSLAALNQSSAFMLRLGIDRETIRRNVEAPLSLLENTRA